MDHEKILILDFGSQYTQLIARRVRELNIYCEIRPYNIDIKITKDIKAIILSGSPFSVRDKESPEINKRERCNRKTFSTSSDMGQHWTKKIN